MGTAAANNRDHKAPPGGGARHATARAPRPPPVVPSDDDDGRARRRAESHTGLVIPPRARARAAFTMADAGDLVVLCGSAADPLVFPGALVQLSGALSAAQRWSSAPMDLRGVVSESTAHRLLAWHRGGGGGRAEWVDAPLGDLVAALRAAHWLDLQPALRECYEELARRVAAEVHQGPPGAFGSGSATDMTPLWMQGGEPYESPFPPSRAQTRI